MADEQITNVNQAGTVYWPLADNLGTVRDLAVYNGGATTVGNHRGFDAFGNSAPAAVDLLFAFTGRPLDRDTGLQNNLHRWYEPTNGRWLSEDPIGFAAGDANLYRYVGNGVTNATDPSGLDPNQPETLPNATPDEKKAIALAGSDAELRKSVVELIQRLRKQQAPSWFNYETVALGGRCVYWKVKAYAAIIDDKALGQIKGIKVTPDWKYYHGWNPLYYEHHYLEFKLSNGAVFYADVWLYGKSDHIFFDLPSSLWDKDKHERYMENINQCIRDYPRGL